MHKQQGHGDEQHDRGVQAVRGEVRQGVQWVTVDEDNDGQRVDNFLLAQLRGVPKSIIYRVIRKGEVRVNKGRVKPDSRGRTGDQVRIPPITRKEKPDQVAPGSPAERGGLRAGDVIVDFDGRPVASTKELVGLLGMQVGRRVKLSVKRRAASRSARRHQPRGTRDRSTVSVAM